MYHALRQIHIHAAHWHHAWSETILSLFLVVFILASPASAALRFQERSLYINNNEPGATTSYTLSFRYMSPQLLGSVDLLFCNDPIPYHPCVKPAGLDVSNSVLATQAGETGYSILTKSNNHIVLTRPPSLMTAGASSYKFDNIKNPTDDSQAFAIRIKSHASTNATGPQIDFGSVRGQVATGVTLQTQVPPMLIFCAAQEVTDDCNQTNDTYYSDMGQLAPSSTLSAQSQMTVGTNASGGFAITANGTSLSAGTNVIDSPLFPTESKPGSNQFGINLVENAIPSIGKNPEGEFANAIASSDYSVPNKYKYVSGDVVAYSPNVSLFKKFTVSYIANSRSDLRAGVYTTTITYIASGRF